MAFVLSNDARKFFQRIGISSAKGDRKSTTGYFDTMFDAFWMCAQIGMLHNRYTPPPAGTPQIVSHFAGKSVQFIHTIRGVTFFKHAQKRGLLEAKEGVISEMEQFFSEHPKGMGPKGYEVMNAFAHGGFDVIFERMGQDCFEMSTFLLEYADLTGAMD